MTISSVYPLQFTFEQKLDHELAKRSLRTAILYIIIAGICLLLIWSKDEKSYLVSKLGLSLVVLSSPIRWYFARRVVMSEVFLKNWSFLHKLSIVFMAFFWATALSGLTLASNLEGWEGFLATLITVSFTVGSIVSLTPSRFLSTFFSSTLTIVFMVSCFFVSDEPSVFSKAITPFVSFLLLLYCFHQSRDTRKELYASINFETSLLKSTQALIESENMLATSKRVALEAQNREMEKDMAVTAAVQSMLLPDSNIILRDHFKVTAFYKPAVQCGGDWWWTYETKDKMFLFVGDVTGHGAGSAMITSLIAASFNMLAPNLLIGRFDLVLRSINETLLKFAKGKFLMTGMAAEYDLASRKIKLWSLGGPHVILNRNAQKSEILGDAGTPFGLDSFQLNFLEHQLEVGDRIFIFTDGIVEFQTKGQRPFGQKRLKRLVESWCDRKLETFPNVLLQELQAHADPFIQDDDFTLVGLEILS